MVLSIDEVNDILDEVYNEFPEPLFEGLNGGVLLLEDELPDPEAGPRRVCHGGVLLGRDGAVYQHLLRLFCGAALGRSREVWVDELRTTLRHELTHHVEGLAGERSLEYKDSAQLEQFQAENQAGQEDGDGV